jgi:hypothetical protein
MHITLDEYDPKPESRLMKIQWLLLLAFLAAWIILALVFFVPTIQTALAQAEEPAAAVALTFKVFLPTI